MNDVYLTNVRLLNFQPYRDTTIPFTKGLNVIVADNQVGKTAFMNALKISVLPDSYDKKDREDFIRNDATYSVILYEFSDGSVDRVDITLKDNVYYTFDSNTKSFKCTGYAPSTSLLQKLGTLVYQGMITNLIDTKQANFLVDTDTKYNNMLLKMLFSHDDLNKIIYNVENIRIPALNKTITEIKSKRDVLEILFNRYKYIDIESLEENVNFNSEILDRVEEMNTILESLDNIQSFKEDVINHKYSLDVCEVLYGLSNKLSNLQYIKNIHENLEDTVEKCSKLASINLNLEEYTEIDETEIQTNLSVIDLLRKHRLQELRNINNIDYTMIYLGGQLHNIVKSLEEVELNGDADQNLELLYKDINKQGGQLYECPIHGKIKYIKGKCIPYNN